MPLTPPGSGCSIAVGIGIVETPPGSVQGLQLVVPDIEAARAQLVERGVEVSPVQHYEGAQRVDGRGGPWNSFVFFSDPDGNGWAVQGRPAARQADGATGPRPAEEPVRRSVTVPVPVEQAFTAFGAGSWSGTRRPAWYSPGRSPPDRAPEPNPAKDSQDEVRFHPDSPSGTGLELEHRGFDRHGQGGDG